VAWAAVRKFLRGKSNTRPIARMAPAKKAETAVNELIYLAQNSLDFFASEIGFDWVCIGFDWVCFGILLAFIGFVLALIGFELGLFFPRSPSVLFS